MDIKVLGTGCSKCKTLEKLTRDAVAETGVAAEIEKIEDIVKIIAFGVMSTPALVINQKVVLSGRIPSMTEMKELLINNQ